MKNLLYFALLALATTSVYGCAEIEGLKETGSTETSVTISWTVDLADGAPLKYRLNVNGLLNVEFLCSEATCSYTMSGLSACGQYDFTLVGVCSLSGSDEVTNTPVLINVNTAYEVPKSVTNLRDETDYIAWDAPINQQCVDFYRVCHTSTVFGNTQCYEVTDTQWDYNNGADTGCDSLSITVAGLTLDGKLGPVSAIQVVTEYGIPSEPRNYVVELVDDDEVHLWWDSPARNAGCISDYSITYGPAEVERLAASESELSKGNLRSDHEATLTNLNLCTNYSIAVAAVSNQNEIGKAVTDYAKTPDMPPDSMPNVEFIPGEESIIVEWGDGTVDACLGFIRICVSDPVSATVDCELIEGSNGNGNYTITGLSPCRTYSFILEGISPGGLNGTVYLNDTHTMDVAPGPVRDLDVITVSITSLGVAWNKPLENEDCVMEYVISYTNMDDVEADPETQTLDALSLSARKDYEDTLAGLSSCVNYKVDVWSLTRSGLASPIETTNGRTADTAPSAPRNPSVVSVTTNSVTLLWFAPAERFCIERYHATFIEVGGGTIIHDWFTPDIPHAEEFIHTFFPDDIQPCTGYEVQLEAYNSFHPSSEVAQVSMTTACAEEDRKKSKHQDEGHDDDDDENED